MKTPLVWTLAAVVLSSCGGGSSKLAGKAANPLGPNGTRAVLNLSVSIALESYERDSAQPLPEGAFEFEVTITNSDTQPAYFVDPQGAPFRTIVTDSEIEFHWAVNKPSVGLSRGVANVPRLHKLDGGEIYTRRFRFTNPTTATDYNRVPVYDANGDFDPDVAPTAVVMQFPLKVRAVVGSNTDEYVPQDAPGGDGDSMIAFHSTWQQVFSSSTITINAPGQ